MSRQLLDSFIAFLKEHPSTFADIKWLENGNQRLTSLLGDRRVNDGSLEFLAANNAGCLLCGWVQSGKTVEDEMPVVWLDSEGSPNAVVATKVSEFISLLPYDTGFMYDAVSSWGYFIEDPEGSRDPLTKFDTQQLLKTSSELHPEQAAFIRWMQSVGIETAPDPVKVIGNAMKQFPTVLG